MSSISPIPAVAGAGGPGGREFLEGLSAGLPPDPGPFPVVVGVSGGGDSVALLRGLRSLGFPAGGRLVVAHAEHDLRDEAAADREFVQALAGRLGVACIIRRLAVAEGPGGEGLEARARRARYAFLAESAHATGGRQVLVAHTADDQAETILHNILRGTGPAGLAGMPRCRALTDGVALVRPLLQVPRATVRPFLEAIGQGWREDVTNADTGRARNFLRHEVLPGCLTGPYPAASEALVRLGRQAATAADLLGEAAGRLLDQSSRRQPDGSVVLRSRDFAGLGEPLLAEVLAALWRREGWPRREMTCSHYEAVAGLVAAAAVGDLTDGGIDMPGGLRVAVDRGGHVRIGPPASALAGPLRPSRKQLGIEGLLPIPAAEPKQSDQEHVAGKHRGRHIGGQLQAAPAAGEPGSLDQWLVVLGMRLGHVLPPADECLLVGDRLGLGILLLEQFQSPHGFLAVIGQDSHLGSIEADGLEPEEGVLRAGLVAVVNLGV